nr:MAG TPA: hypothetical protein [Caudoviricetes sp.]
MIGAVLRGPVHGEARGSINRGMTSESGSKLGFQHWGGHRPRYPPLGDSYQWGPKPCDLVAMEESCFRLGLTCKTSRSGTRGPIASGTAARLIGM